jgi:hypothetical protein
MRWVFSVLSLAIISVSAQLNAQAPAFGTCKPISERTGEVGCWILAAIRHGDRAALAHAFVTFALKPVGTIEQMKMAAVSRLAHFSFDSNPLFTPVSKESHQSCTTRVTTAGSSKS